MQVIYLLRHGQAGHDPRLSSDFERPLTKKGKADVQWMAGYFSRKKYQPEVILCSSAKRAKETLAPILEVLPEEPEVSYLDSLYLAPAETVGELVNETPADKVLVVGHNSGLENYLSDLLGQPMHMGTSTLAVVDPIHHDLLDQVSPS